MFIALGWQALWGANFEFIGGIMRPGVLVTGANGYTGSWLSKYLAQRGVKLRAMYWAPDGEPDFKHENIEFVAGDLRDKESLKRALDGIEVVHNVAALYRPTNVPEQLYWDVNVTGIQNIVELSAAMGVKRFVQCSTIGVHGNVANPPANENAPIKPDDYYQLTKYKGEVLSLELGRSLSLPVSVIRPAAIYGARETRFLKLAKVLQSGRFVMFGKGDVCYHFIYIDDLCDAFVRCAEKPQAVGEVFIIADDKAVTLNKIVEIMCDELDVPTPKLHLPYFLLYGASAVCELACKPFHISPPLHRRRAEWFNSMRSFDISKARRVIGYEPQVSAEQGLRIMVRSFIDAGWIAPPKSRRVEIHRDNPRPAARG